MVAFINCHVAEIVALCCGVMIGQLAALALTWSH
jgi:hypothetical protein